MPAQIGDTNPHGQILVAKTPDLSPNHRLAKVWILKCPRHGNYKANSCDFHIRRCPVEGGKAGLDLLKQEQRHRRDVD